MTFVNRAKFVSVLLFAATLLLGVPAFGQMAELSGEYSNLNHEDARERAGGPPLGDYLGIPLNEAGLFRADANDTSDWGLPEFGCRPHSAPYQWRSASGVQIRKEVDPVSRELRALHFQWSRAVDRPIYMDGRPHPDEYGLHTWAGFSTGRFIGNILEITTTHLKESYMRRNGAYFSDKATMKEYMYRRGDYLTLVMILTDPVYLAEPFVQTTNYRYNPNILLQFYPCTVIDEGLTDRRVPHFLPGTNPYLTEWMKGDNIPETIPRGGVETMYPEFRKSDKMRQSSNN
jgi:hypothetical protein